MRKAFGPSEETGTPGATQLLWLLLAADAIFVIVHLWAAFARPEYRLLNIEADNSYPELFQYLKLLWLALLLAGLALRRGAAGYLAWSALFLYLLFDDMFRLHEDGGAALAEAWGLAPALGLRGKDFGELAVSLAAALVLLPPIALAHRLGAVGLRSLSRHLALLLLALVACGVGLDLLLTALKPAGVSRILLGTLEDGGEMVIVSLMLWRAFAAALQPVAPAAAPSHASVSARTSGEGLPL